MDKRVNLYRNFCYEYLQEKQTPGVKNTRHLWSHLMSKDLEGPSHVSYLTKTCSFELSWQENFIPDPDLQASEQPNWPVEDLMSIGTILYSFVLKDCKVNANIMTNKPP